MDISDGAPFIAPYRQHISDDFSGIEEEILDAGFKKTTFSSTRVETKGRNFKKDHVVIRVERAMRNHYINGGNSRREVIEFHIKSRTANGGTTNVARAGWLVKKKKAYTMSRMSTDGAATTPDTLSELVELVIKRALEVKYVAGTGITPREFVEPEFETVVHQVKHKFNFVVKSSVLTIAHLRDDGRFLLDVKNPKTDNLWFIVYVHNDSGDTNTIAFKDDKYYFLRSAQLHKKKTWAIDNHPKSLSWNQPMSNLSLSILRESVRVFLKLEFSHDT